MKYTCKKGCSDWRPIDSFSLPVQSFKHQWAVTFDESCWYDTKQVGDHWNKGGGFVPLFQFSNICNNFMWAWRPAQEQGSFEVTWYRNYKNADDFAFGESQFVKAGITFDVVIWHTVTSIKFDIAIPNKAVFQYDTKLDKDYKFYRRLGLWFGGKPKAPQDMSMEVAHSKPKGTVIEIPT